MDPETDIPASPAPEAANAAGGKPRSRLRRVLRRLAVAAAVAVLVPSAIVGWTAASILATGARASRGGADAALVLGAAVWGEAPSPAFRERIRHAANLQAGGTVGKIVFTGAIGQAGERAESEVAREFALGLGVPPDAILVETRSRTTYENLLYGGELARESGLETLLLVSDPLHLKRATTMARDLGLDARPSPTPSTVFRTWKTKRAFLMRETYFLLRYRWLRLFGEPLVGEKPEIGAGGSGSRIEESRAGATHRTESIA